MLVSSRMTANVITATPDSSIAEALAVTRANRIRHLPVVENGRLVGLVTDRDLRLALPPAWATEHEELMAALNQRRISEVMVRDIRTATPDMPIEEAAKMLYTHRIGCVPVLDADGTLVGILSETDLLRAFTELFGAQTPSARVEVQMPNRPGELARVVRLIGIENRVNITGMVVPPRVVGDDSVAIIHLEVADPDAIVRSLRKIGYRVGMPSLETDPNVDLELEEERERGPSPRMMAEL